LKEKNWEPSRVCGLIEGGNPKEVGKGLRIEVLIKRGESKDQAEVYSKGELNPTRVHSTSDS